MPLGAIVYTILLPHDVYPWWHTFGLIVIGGLAIIGALVVIAIIIAMAAVVGASDVPPGVAEFPNPNARSARSDRPYTRSSYGIDL